MSKKCINTAKLVLLLILAAALIHVLWRQFDYQKGEQDYREAMELAGVAGQAGDRAGGVWEEALKAASQEGQSGEAAPSDIPLDWEEGRDKDKASEGEGASAGIDLAALQKVNPDVAGWIMITGTPVSYPVLQGKDNRYYLDHTWKGERNSVGSIFMECQNPPDFGGFHTILYGHRMRNGSMFGSLKEYNRADYWKEHPFIYIASSEGAYQYQIFAAYEAQVRDMTFALELPDSERKEKFIQFGLEQSVIDTRIVPDGKNPILTLSTCTGRGYDSRWVVQAVKVSDDYNNSF